MRQRTKAQRNDALYRKRDEGEGARILLETQAVTDWFKSQRVTLIDAMIACKPDDDDGRRDKALQLKALDSLRASLSAKAKTGARAQEKIENGQS